MFYSVGALELSILIALKSYASIPGLSTKYSETLYSLAQYIFVLFSTVFVYVVSQEILSIRTKFGLYLFVIPMVPAAVFTLPMANLLRRVGFAGRIKFEVGPADARVYGDYEGSSVYWFIYNGDKKKHTFHVRMDLPNGLIARSSELDDEETLKLEREFDIEPGKQSHYDIELKNSSGTSGTEKLTFTIDCDDKFSLKRELVIRLVN